MIHRWRDISRAPESPGIYAWYFSPEITTFDMEKTIEQVLRAVQEERESDAFSVVSEFLEQSLFRHLREDPYSAVVRGPLKPTFVGELTHQATISSSLVQRIVANPNRLRTIKNVVEQSAPEFSSPLYIGMASNLRNRLTRHKAMIESPIDASDLSPPDETSDAESHQLLRDRNFAERIQSRKIPPTRLFVATKIVDDNEGEYVDVENLLNRLHFPLLGRN